MVVNLLSIKLTIKLDCNSRRQFFKWLYWDLTDEIGSNLVDDLGNSSNNMNFVDLTIKVTQIYLRIYINKY